jgi:hypothetical protein
VFQQWAKRRELALRRLRRIPLRLYRQAMLLGIIEKGIPHGQLNKQFHSHAISATNTSHVNVTSSTLFLIAIPDACKEQQANQT